MTPMIPAASLEERARRCRQYFEATSRFARDWYDDAGQWIAGNPPPGTRDRYWLSFALYAMGHHAWADAIVLGGSIDNSGENRGLATQFNIFWTNIAVALLVVHGDKMGPAARARLEEAAQSVFEFKPGNRQPDYQFHGYNDNMPSKASMGLILAGEMFGRQDAVEHGLYNLRQMRAQLIRRGIHSEYNSPTYTPGTILGFSKIAEYARNPEAREIALAIEHRLWIDLAARFHPEIGIMSGPYSRAYTIDLLGYVSGAACMLWFALGDIARPSPMEFFVEDSDLVQHHQGDIPFSISGACWQAVTHYHIPDRALELFAKKKYPFRAVATAEMGDAGPDYPARPTRIETRIERDFTVGTSITPFLSGEQSAGYLVTYKRRENVRTAADFGTIFTKIVVNDAQPGAFTDPSTRRDGTPYCRFIEQDNLDCKSYCIDFQSGATVLHLSHPNPGLAGDPDYPDRRGAPISRLRELILFPAHFGGADEILVDGEPRSEWSGPVGPKSWIACRRGRLLCAYRPLAHAAHFGEPRLSLEKINRYEVISAELFRGEPRQFARGELRHMFGGFVAEHAGIDDYPSLADFAAALKEARFTDFFFTTRRVRYRRGRTATAEPLDMEISWSTGSHQTRYAVINGQPQAWPLVEIDGVEPRELPFLDGPWQPIPGYFPWKNMELAQMDLVYSIHDRELL